MKSFYKNQNLNLIASTAQQIVFNNSKNGKLESTNTQDAIDEISNILDEEKTMISDAWNSATTYTVGQYCIYNNTLWKCLVQHKGQVPSEGTYWTKTQIDDEMLAIKNDVSTLNSDFDEFFIAKGYLVNKTINAYCTENVSIDNIAGYTPIGCFYDCNTGETVTCATAPRRRKSDNTFSVGIINGYQLQISTQGIIYVYYIKNIDIQ